MNWPGASTARSTARISSRAEGGLVALFCKQGSLQLSEGLGAAVVVIGFELFSKLADGGGELLGLDQGLLQQKAIA